MKTFKNTNENFKEMYNNGQFLRLVVPHNNDQYNNVYKETEKNHEFKNVDYLYVVQYKGQIIGCPKDLSAIKIDLVHTLVDDYAEKNFQFREENYNGVKVCYITTTQIYYGASIIATRTVRNKISQLFLNRSFYFMFIDENQIICFPTRITGKTKEESDNIISLFKNIIINKYSYPLSKFMYLCDGKTKEIILNN